jgi:hypothetical protein
VHFVFFPVTDAVAGYLPVVESKERSGAYHVKPSVDAEELEGRRNVGMSLDFVEEDKRFAWDETERVVDAGNGGNDGIRLVSVCGDCLESRRIHKVDLDNAGIVSGGKVTNGLRLADLPGTLDYERFPLLAGLPIFEESVDFSGYIHNTSIVCRVVYHIAMGAVNTFRSELDSEINTFRSEYYVLSYTFRSELDSASYPKGALSKHKSTNRQAAKGQKK